MEHLDIVLISFTTCEPGLLYTNQLNQGKARLFFTKGSPDFIFYSFVCSRSGHVLEVDCKNVCVRSARRLLPAQPRGDREEQAGISSGGSQEQAGRGENNQGPPPPPVGSEICSNQPVLYLLLKDYFEVD